MTVERQQAADPIGAAAEQIFSEVAERMNTLKRIFEKIADFQGDTEELELLALGGKSIVLATGFLADEAAVALSEEGLMATKSNAEWLHGDCNAACLSILAQR